MGHLHHVTPHFPPVIPEILNNSDKYPQFRDRCPPFISNYQYKPHNYQPHSYPRVYNRYPSFGAVHQPVAYQKKPVAGHMAPQQAKSDESANKNGNNNNETTDGNAVPNQAKGLNCCFV